MWALGPAPALSSEASVPPLQPRACSSPAPLSLTFPFSAKPEQHPKPRCPGDTPEGPPVQGSLQWDRWTVQNKAGGPFCIRLRHRHPAPTPQGNSQ